jgi:hypothetical protein
VTEACLRKTEARNQWKPKTGLEEVKATGLEANQEKIGATAEHQKDPNEDSTVEKIGALED